MTRAQYAWLEDRGVVSVSGEDAAKLLQGIVTNDVELLNAQPAIHTALLTPQGKILFEFFVAKTGTGYLVDVAASQAGDLVKRLTMYKLRAKVDISDASAGYRVVAVWGPSLHGLRPPPDSLSFIDPRLPGLGLRILAQTRSAADVVASSNATEATISEYDAHRIALGVPEITKDYAPNGTFAHEANLDTLRSVSFSKGCFIGQEVASRMEHRGTARTRAVIVESITQLSPKSEIMAGDAAIGTVGSTAGNRGIALVRLDRADEAQAKGKPLKVGEATIAIHRPSYLKTATAAAP